MKINNPIYELRLELEEINEKINEFWEYYEYLNTADNTTKRYYRDLFQELTNGNFLNAKLCIEKLIERLTKEVEYPIYSYVTNLFQDGIDSLKQADMLCDKAINLALESNVDEKTRLQKQRKDINIRLTELSDEKTPYLNLALSIMFIVMSVIFVFLPNFFNSPILTYHLCGAMFLLGFILIKQEVEFRNKKGFISNSKNSTNKRSIILLIQAFAYIIPLVVLSFFFFDSIWLRIALCIQIWFCGVLFLCGLFIMINNAIKNKKSDGESVCGIILGIITIAAFVLQLLQIFKVV